MEICNLKGPVTKCAKCILNKGLIPSFFWLQLYIKLYNWLKEHNFTVSSVAHMHIFVWLKPSIYIFFLIYVHSFLFQHNKCISLLKLSATIYRGRNVKIINKWQRHCINNIPSQTSYLFWILNLVFFGLWLDSKSML